MKKKILRRKRTNKKINKWPYANFKKKTKPNKTLCIWSPGLLLSTWASKHYFFFLIIKLYVFHHVWNPLCPRPQSLSFCLECAPLLVPSPLIKSPTIYPGDWKWTWIPSLTPFQTSNPLPGLLIWIFKYFISFSVLLWGLLLQECRASTYNIVLWAKAKWPDISKS